MSGPAGGSPLHFMDVDPPDRRLVYIGPSGGGVFEIADGGSS